MRPLAEINIHVGKRRFYDGLRAGNLTPVHRNAERGVRAPPPAEAY
jgi:hypothetical protein